MTVRSIKSQDIPMIASGMAGRNQLPADRCGFLGTDVAEIQQYLYEIYEDGGSILLSKDGMVAGDVVDDNRSVEVLGPYADSVITAIELIEELRYRHPSYDLLFFVDRANQTVLQAINQLGGNEQTEHWELTRPVSPVETDPAIRLIRRGEYVRTLHNRLFPKAYYSGETLEEMAFAGQASLAVYREAGIVKGYIFYQADSGYIDFIGVEETARNQGIGKRLIDFASHDVYSQGGDALHMAVQQTNQVAKQFMLDQGFTMAEENISIRLRG